QPPVRNHGASRMCSSPPIDFDVSEREAGGGRSRGMTRDHGQRLEDSPGKTCPGRVHDARVMRPPFFILEVNGDVTACDTAQAAESAVESIDVEDWGIASGVRYRWAAARFARRRADEEAQVAMMVPLGHQHRIDAGAPTPS